LRKYSCDDLFFSQENEKSFYWAGFIAADGCVFQRGNNKQLIISLSEKDIDHLIVFKNDIKFNGKIYTTIAKHNLTNPKWNNSVKKGIRITSSQIFEDLKQFNIIPNKTKTYSFPKWLESHELVNHFMRGYIDGDGSFFIDNNRSRICFELRGNCNFLASFQKIIENSLKQKTKVSITTPDSTSKIKYNGKKIVPQIVDFIYKNAVTYLPRKYEISQKSKEYLEL